MSKTKKSKLLASMLCATVLAGLYAGPVMAGDGSVDADDSGITISISQNHSGSDIDNDQGLFVKPPIGQESNLYKVFGNLKIKSDQLITALEGKSFNELTIGGQTFNSTQIDAFKQDYQQLKDDVAALDTTDLTGRVNALEANTAGISRSGSTTMVNGNIRATANIIANQRIGVVNGSRFGMIAEKDTLALGDFKINDPAETIKENAKFYVDGSTGNVMTKGDVATEAGYSLNSVGANTAGIERYGGNNTSIEGTLKVHGGGSGSVDVYGGMIQSKNAQGGMGYMDGDKLVLTTDIHGNQTTIKGGSINTNTVYAAGDVVANGELKSANGLVAGTDGNGTFKVKNIDGNTMAYMVDKDGNYTVGINAQNGNIETKGALAVTNAAGNNVFTANSDGMSVGGGNFAVDAATGNTKIAGGLNVGTNIEVAGGITANSLKLGAIDNVEATINALDEGLGNVGEAVNGLEGKVNVIENNTTGISYDKGVTTIAETAKFGKGYMQVGSTILAKDGSIGAANGKFTVTPDGEVIVSGENGSTNINGNGITVGDTAITNGVITTHKADIGGVEIANGRVDGVDVSELSGSVFDNSKDITELERKTTGIDYANGTTTIAGSTSFDANGMKTSNIEASSGTVGGVAMSDGGIVTDRNALSVVGGVSMAGGRLQAEQGTIGGVAIKDGHVDGVDVSQLRDTVAGNVVDIGELQEKTTDIKYADGVTEIGKGVLAVNNEGYVTINNGMLTVDAESGYVTMGNKIEFDTANGTVTAKNFYTDKYDLNSIGSQLDELETGVGETNKNVAGIKREGETTIIEGATNFDANGMKVGNNVTINKDGSMTARNGDAYFNFDQGNVALGNGTNSVMVGNNSITLDADGTALTMNHDGLDYADGAFTVRNDGTVYANGSMTADDFITKDGIKLSEVNDKLGDLEGSVGETNKNVAGIKREEVNGDYVTVIEDYMRISNKGVSLDADKFGFTYTTSDGSIGVGNLGDLANKVNEIDDRLDVVEDKTQNINSSGEIGKPGEGGNQIEVPPTTDGETGINGDATVGGDLTVGGSVTAGEGNFSDKVTVGGENGTSIDKDGVNVGGENGTSITDKDVVINQGTDNEVSLSDVGNRVDNLEQGMASMSNRISKVEDRIDKVGAMSAAIANLRTMGYDPTAPTEIAVGIGQYRSETGAALGLFHYPNKDFMLSLSVSTSGDEVMGGIGATWKFGRKSPEQMLAAEKEKAAKAKLAKAEAMKKAAAEAKVAEQQAKHAKMAAEKAAK